MKKRLTPMQKAWNKEIERLRKFQSRAEKRGYTFSEDFIPERPRRITKKRLAELKARTPKTEYAKAQYTTPTGTKVSGTEGRKMERSAAARRGAQSRAAKRRESAEPTGAPDDSVGEFNVIEQIIQGFGGIPEVKYGGKYQNLIDLESGKQVCVNLLLNEWDRRTDMGAGAEYADYLRSIESALAYEISQIIYNDSDQETVDGHYSYIASMIKGGPLTMSEAQEMETAYSAGEEPNE